MTDAECTLRHLVGIDVNMAFAAGANGLVVGLGAPAHVASGAVTGLGVSSLRFRRDGNLGYAFQEGFDSDTGVTVTLSSQAAMFLASSSWTWCRPAPGRPTISVGYVCGSAPDTQ